MSAEMFGWGNGTRLAESDMQRMAINRLNMVDEFEQIQTRPVARRMLEANVEKQETENENQRKMSELLQKSAEGEEIDPVARLEQVAGAAFNAGLTKDGLAMTKAAGTLRLQQVQGLTAAQRALAAQGKQRIAAFETSAQLMSGAKDQGQWERAIELSEDVTGQPSPFRGMPFTPENQRLAVSGALKLKDQIGIEQKDAELKLREKRDQIDAGYKEFLKRIRTREVELKETAEARRAKQGTTGRMGNDRFPNSAETQAAAALIKSEFPDIGADDEGKIQLTNAAVAIAADAKARVKAIPGLDAATALQQAMNAHRADFGQGEDGGGGFFGALKRHTIGGKKRVTFTGGGKSPETAIAPPMLDGKLDPAQLKDGRYYSTPKGPARYLGDGKWELVGGSGGGGGGNDGNDAEDDDDADD